MQIAHMRAQIRKVAASGTDVLNAADLKRAIDYHGGVTACQSAHIEINSTSTSSGACLIKGISKISNVSFNNDSSITVWRAFEIGDGVRIVLQPQEGHFESKIDVYEDVTIPKIADGYIKSPVVQKELDGNFSISCPENGCICTFNSYFGMQNHCLLGNHEFKSQSTSSTCDMIKLRWKDTCCNISSEAQKVKFESGMKIASNESLMGWALKKDKKCVRFSEKVKNYLQGIFEAG